MAIVTNFSDTYKAVTRWQTWPIISDKLRMLLRIDNWIDQAKLGQMNDFLNFVLLSYKLLAYTSQLLCTFLPVGSIDQ